LRLEDVRLVHGGLVCWFVKNVLKQGAMTISPWIFYGRARFDPAQLGAVALLAHELKHIEQFRQLGHLRFFLRYFSDLAQHGFRYSRLLVLEAEAYELQAVVRETLRPAFPEV
jgi:hypothetical protein